MAGQSSERSSLGERLAVVPGVVAIALALLYGLGGIFRASELSRAGYSVRDTLPLFPVSQLLARGVAVVWDNVVGILLFGVFFVLMAFLARWIEDRSSAADEVLAARRSRLDGLIAKVEEEGDPDEELRELRAEFDEFKREVAGREELTPEEAARLDDFEARIDAVIERRAELLGELDAIRAMPSVSEIYGSLGKLFTRGVPKLLVVVLGLFVVGSLLIDTPAFAVGIWVPLIAVTVWTWRGRRRMPLYPHAVAFVVAAVVVAELAASAISPLPLSRVSLREVRGRAHGEFIAFAGDTWYVGLPHGRVLAVPSREVVSSEVVPPRSHQRPKFIYQYLGL